MFATKHRMDADAMLWEWDMARLMQVMHAHGCANGNRYRWLRHYDAPELLAAIKPNVEPVTFEEIESW